MNPSIFPAIKRHIEAHHEHERTEVHVADLHAMFEQLDGILEPHHFFSKGSPYSPVNRIEVSLEAVMFQCRDASEKSTAQLLRVSASDVVVVCVRLLEFKEDVSGTRRANDLERPRGIPGMGVELVANIAVDVLVLLAGT
ncbi:MAG: hypothetical protein SGI92_31470 [Bryobacteraceae bacterium]|nr:hypothetical protein [Bryobacteraceae bacterium]